MAGRRVSGKREAGRYGTGSERLAGRPVLRRFPLPAHRILGCLALLGILAAGIEPLAAQSDPSGHWRTWHTTHFRVHARAENEALARHAAVKAEQAYAWLASELQPPRGTIDLVLYDNADFSNGFTSVLPSLRIVVYLTPPAGDPQLAPYDDWLRLVITHELTHAFHLDRTRGIWKLAQYLFGRAPGSFPNTYQPSWVTEGLAEYYESRLSTSGRLRGGMQDQLLAAAAVDHWPRPGDATLLSPQWPAGYLPYAWGAQFFATEQRARGDSVVPRFVERAAKQLWPFATSRPLEGAGGIAVDSAWAAMRARWDSLAVDGPRGSVLVRGLRTAPRPRLSADGERLAYVEATGRSDPRVVVIDPGSARVLAAHRVNGGVDLAWLADTLYVSQLDFTSPVTGRTALYRWVPHGPWEHVRGSARLARPFAGPDGALLAVDVAAASDAVVRLTGERRTALAVPAADAWSYLAASPDGRWLAGARHTAGQWDIVAWPDGHPERAAAVTSDAPVDDDPAWAPAGDRVLFTSERGGLPQILAYSLRDGTVSRLTDAPAGARQPAPAPDGTLYYATFLWDGWAIARMRPLALAPAAAPPPPQLGRDTLGATPIRVGGYSPWPSLLPHYWLPTWHDVPGGEWFVGARVTGVDAVGRTAYLAQFALAPSNGRAEYDLEVVHQRWRATSLHASLAQSWDAFEEFRSLSNGDTVTIGFGKRDLVAALGARRDWRRWRTFASALVEGEYERASYTIDRSRIAGLQLIQDHHDFLGAVVSVSGQHFSHPALAISPENGLGAGVLYRRHWETTGSGWWTEWRGATSAYLALPLPGFAHWVLALRGAAGVRGGPSADRYAVGGVSGDPYQIVPGYVIGPRRRVFPLRGYPAASVDPVTGVGFTRAAVEALELRVPVALVARSLGKLPLGLDRVSFTGFAEAGGGWSAAQSLDAFALRDAGAELVVDAGVPQDASIRLRVGVAVPLVTGLGVTAGTARGYLAFGTAF